MALPVELMAKSKYPGLWSAPEMVLTTPQVFVVRFPSTDARVVRLGFPHPTKVAWPAESLAKTRFSVATPLVKPIVDKDATTTGDDQVLPCRTRETKLPPD